MKDVARFFKVLSDEARLQILWLLFSRDELCVCDLVEALGITQSKASRHLATLRNAGLVVDRRAGPWSYYSVRPARNEFERTHLELMRRELAQHPEAESVLGALRAWMDRKDRAEACPAAVRPSAIRTKRSPRGALTGKTGEA